jgi:DNA processing protein
MLTLTKNYREIFMLKTENNLTDWLRLYFIEQLGLRITYKLLQYFKSPKNIFSADESILKSLKLNAQQIQQIKTPNNKLIDESLKWVDTENQHIITIADNQYPSRLKEISRPPLLLFIKGQINCLAQLQLAMVGSRNPSPTGLQNAKQFAFELAQAGLTITSGLAIGIDGASHQGALAADGTTIAVLGSGLHYIYPKRHCKLADQIMETGALISEFPLSLSPQPKNFPQRNRIISGLSLGTLVVEATNRSGSLITAKFAIEQNRDVFAIPGALQNPLARGCHQLLQQGAKLITDVADILEELPDLEYNACTKKTQKMSQTLDSTDRKLLECVGFELTSIDEIIERSGQSTAYVNSRLLNLELHGYIKQHLGGYWRVAE